MAETPGEITLAFTLKSPWLTSAILRGLKPVENRSVTWKPGWYGLHTGVAKDADRWAEQHVCAATDDAGFATVAMDVASSKVPKGALVGAVAISHALPTGSIVDSDGRPSPWALGPFCMVISKTIWLSEPVPCKGQLGTWRLLPRDRELLAARLVSSSTMSTGAAVKYPSDPAAVNALRAKQREARRAAKRAREDESISHDVDELRK